MEGNAGNTVTRVVEGGGPDTRQGAGAVVWAPGAEILIRAAPKGMLAGDGK